MKRLPLKVRQLTSPSIFKKKLRDKFQLTNNLISDILFLHMASLKSRCFLFIFIILVFILAFRLLRKLFLLYLNVNTMEIPCLIKLPYLTLQTKDKPKPITISNINETSSPAVEFISSLQTSTTVGVAHVMESSSVCRNRQHH